jgi:hypothetical protein
VAASERGGVKRFFSTLLSVVLILGLAAAVVYLVSDINRRHYRLVVQNGLLLVERGLFFPTGFGPYIPETDALREAYAPVPVPPNEVLASSAPLEDRADVDRTLFSLLSGWARSRMEATDIPTLELAASYVKRLEILPGLSEEQRLELRTLRANLAYRNGRRLMDGVVEQLQKAKAALQLAVELGTAHAEEARAAQAEVDRRLTVYRDLAPAPTSPHR